MIFECPKNSDGIYTHNTVIKENKYTLQFVFINIFLNDPNPKMVN